MLDISLCSSENCPKYNECYRGGGTKHVGINTVSDFIQECTELNGYGWFIPCDEADPFRKDVR